MQRIKVIDSHTGGEPTRVVVSGGPDLGKDALASRLERFRDQHDDFRSAIVNEPRGSDVMVGALLCIPVDLELRRRESSSLITLAIWECAVTGPSA